MQLYDCIFLVTRHESNKSLLGDNEVWKPGHLLASSFKKYSDSGVLNEP